MELTGVANLTRVPKLHHQIHDRHVVTQGERFGAPGRNASVIDPVYARRPHKKPALDDSVPNRASRHGIQGEVPDFLCRLGHPPISHGKQSPLHLGYLEGVKRLSKSPGRDDSEKVWGFNFHGEAGDGLKAFAVWKGHRKLGRRR